MSKGFEFILLSAAHFMTHFFLLIFPTAVLVIYRAWDISYGLALSLSAAAFLALALGTLPAGWLGDHWGRRRMMIVFFFGIGAASILTGLATGPVMLVIGLSLIGLFAAIYHPVATSMLVQMTDRPGRTLGINGIFGNLGVAASSITTAVLIAWGGWQASFIVPGIIAFCCGLVYLIASKARKYGPAPVQAKSSKPLPLAPKMIVVFAIVGISALFGGIVFQGITIGMPKLFEDQLPAIASSITEVGYAVSLVFLFAAGTQYIVGHMLDRFGAKVVLLVLLGAQAPVLVAMGLVSDWPLLLIAVLGAALVFGEAPINAWILSKYVPPTWQSRVFAAEYMVSLGISALAVPAIGGLYDYTGGFMVIFAFLGGCAFIVFIVGWLLPWKFPQAATD